VNKGFRLLLTSLITLSLILTSVGGVAAQGGEVQTSLAKYRDVFATADLYALALQGGDQVVDINLIVTTDANISKLMPNAIVRNPVAGIRGVTGSIKANLLGKLAATPGVLEIRPFVLKAATTRPVPPDAARPAVERGAKGLLRRSGPTMTINKATGGAASAGAPQLSSYMGIDLMGARQAWDMGFTGEGVIVGHVDDGCDFGHPDLEGTWAVVEDPGSPYYGWPMVYDPGPALLYVGYGEVFNWQSVWDETLGGLYSYYVDTSATPEVTVSASGITATAVITTVGYADPPHYTEPAILAHEYTFAHTSKSGVYKVGIHPEALLSYFNEPGEYVAVLVVDEAVAGVYDAVYVDWDSNYVFDTYERFSKAHPTGWYYDEATETWSRDVNGDAIADVSAGILYWIADGENVVPGTDVLYPPAYLAPPASGELVLFYGDYNGNSHGTGTAAAVAAQGVITGTVSAVGAMIPAWADASDGVVYGTAPDAKLFSSNLFNVGTTDVDSWTIHLLGYDGAPGTGDEAQISTNSWGNTNRDDAWTADSRLITRLNMVFPTMTWFFGTANGGFGYGTSSSPATGPTAIGVAGVDLNGPILDVSAEPIASADQILYGDLTPYSSRGPNTAGRGDADIMSIADGATGDMPLLLAVLDSGEFDGQMAWEEFGGTSQATPFTAGIGALVCQAYKAKTGEWPDYATLQSILMSTAQDANNDPFVQGAGRAYAKLAVQVAAGLGGFRVSPSRWDAGDYRGATYDDFARLVAPGESAQQTFTVHNTSAATMTLTISDEVLKEIGAFEMTLTTTVAAEEPTRNISKPDYLVPLYVKDGVNRIPEGTDLMVVSVASPWEKFSMGDPTVPASMTVDSLWYMKVLNWTDLNENGVLWFDTNANGAVNNGELDNRPDLGDPELDESSVEINEFSLSYQYGTTKECRVEKPLERADDGIYIGLIHYTSTARDVGKPFPETPLKIRVAFYQHADMNWIESAPLTLTVGAGLTATFTSTVAVPEGTPAGLYQGSVRVSGGEQETVIPTVVNVPAVVTAENLNFAFGGRNPSGYLFDNSYVYGGFDWLGNGWYDQGDWRMYFVDVPDDAELPAGTRWLVDTRWQSPYTDIDTLVLGPTPDTYSARWPHAFGPYTLDLTGGSQDTAYRRDQIWDWGQYAFSWKTNTGEAQETVTAKLLPGLNAIMLQNVLYGGIDTRERFTGTVGTVSVAPWPIEVTTNELNGSATFTLTSSIALSGLGYGGSFGLSKPMRYLDQPIQQSQNKYFQFTVEDSALLELALSTKDPDSTPDLDLVLYRAVGGKWTQVTYSAGATSDEHIRIVRPPAGRYLAAVQGYAVIGTGTFDLIIRSVEGHDLTVTGIPTGTIEAGEVYHLTLDYAKTAATGTYEGLILLGTDKAPAILEVPVQITFETVELTHSTKAAEETVTWGDMIHYEIVVANSGNITGTVSVEDWLPQSENIMLVADTLTATMGIPLWDPAANDGFGAITWDGALAAGETITITFAVQTVKPASGVTEVLTNTVTLKSGVNPDVTKAAVTTVKPYLRLVMPLIAKP